MLTQPELWELQHTAYVHLNRIWSELGKEQGPRYYEFQNAYACIFYNYAEGEDITAELTAFCTEHDLDISKMHPTSPAVEESLRLYELEELRMDLQD
jgi:hypothetical protein